MAEQTFVPGRASTRIAVRVRWTFSTPRPQFIDGLVDSDPVFLGELNIRTDSHLGNVQLLLGGTNSENPASTGNELSSTWEASATAITIQAGSFSATIIGPTHPDATTPDATEPYRWFIPDDIASIIADHNALSQSDQEAITLTFNDGLSAPEFADDTGDAISGIVGVAIADVVVPEADGTPTPTYTAVVALPPGISFDAGTRTLSFDEDSIEVGTGTITIRAMNSEGFDDWTVPYNFVALDVALIGQSLDFDISLSHANLSVIAPGEVILQGRSLDLDLGLTRANLAAVSPGEVVLQGREY